MAWDQTVPFSDKGDLLTYVHGNGHGILAGTRYGSVPATWKANFSFKAVLELEGMTRGRSAARFIWADQNGCKYEMFMADMVELIQSGVTIERGHCDATWTFTKKGQNYGVKVDAPVQT